MDISFSVETEKRLQQFASETGRAADEVVREIVTRYFDHAEWFAAEVQAGMVSLDRGESIPHDEVGRDLARHLKSVITAD